MLHFYCKYLIFLLFIQKETFRNFFDKAPRDLLPLAIKRRTNCDNQWDLKSICIQKEMWLACQPHKIDVFVQVFSSDG